MIKCIIVDDEPLAIELLESYIQQVSFLQLEKSFINPTEALLYLETNQIDLVFLDIQMPLVNGLRFPSMVQQMPAFIFVTAYEEYALESYKLEASSYLMKPVAFEDFYRAVQRVCKQSKKDAIASTQLESIFVKTDKKIVQLPLNTIEYIEGLKDYVCIYVDGKKWVTRESLKKLTELLSDAGFIRVHKSYIVPLDRIKELEGNLLRLEQKVLPVGKSFRNALLVKMDETMIGNR